MPYNVSTGMTSQLNMIRPYSARTSEIPEAANEEQVDRILAAERRRQPGRNWPRLDNTERVLLLRDYADEYARANEFDEEKSCKLKLFLEEAVRRKKLTRVKEVVFDKDKNRILGIPGLEHDKESHVFTLKRVFSHKQKKAKDCT